MTGKKYKLTPEAIQDIAGIQRYTDTKWSIEQSDKYLSGMTEAMTMLGEHPKAGTIKPEIVGKRKLYSFRYERHFIYYKISTGFIVITAVISISMHQKGQVKGR